MLTCGPRRRSTRRTNACVGVVSRAPRLGLLSVNLTNVLDSSAVARSFKSSARITESGVSLAFLLELRNIRQRHPTGDIGRAPLRARCATHAPSARIPDRHRALRDRSATAVV